MSQTPHTWPADALDAISISLTDGDVSVVATDEGQIRIDGADSRDRWPVGGIDRLEPAGRWLVVQLMARRGDEPLTVYLPRSKQWQVDVSVVHGDVAVAGVSGRLHAMTGQGDVHLAHCLGVFEVGCGAGDVELEHCRQAGALPPLALPDGEPERSGVFASPARSIAAAMSSLERRLARLPGWNAPKAGDVIAVHSGSGDVQINDLDAQSCAIRLGRGDMSLEDGRIGTLYASVGQGDIECEGVMPLSSWDIETVHGDISLALPAGVAVRFDAATSHGDIDSAAPLVRVARPGPESRHGGRMVGSYGRADAQSPQIRLTTSRGDIEIELADGEAATEAEAPAAAIVAVADQEAGADQPAPGSELEVLKALSEGLIDAAEAERLLRSMGA